MAYGTYEVVQVLGDAFLITSTWRMCRYVTRDSQLLGPGFYFVMWPAARAVFSGHNQYARCFGPFPTKIMADKLKTSALGLGMITLNSSTMVREANSLYSLEWSRTRCGPSWLKDQPVLTS